MTTGRKLKLKQRAERMEETHRRIAKATYELHCTVGLAHTTISAVAERAGVERVTVYHHFPEERDLYQGCVQYHFDVAPPPDPAAWRQVADPESRLRQGLAELYAYFARHEPLFVNAVRDVPLVLERLGGDAPEALTRYLALSDQWRDALGDAWAPFAEPAPMLRAILGLAVDFSVWHTLARGQGLDETQTLDLMVHLVTCMVAARPPERGSEALGSEPTTRAG